MKDTRSLGLGGKLWLLGSLYVAQGLPFGFFTQTLPAYMRKQGYSLAAISGTALLTLPWALKWLWAPLVDRWPAPAPGVRARRKRWILACQVLAALVFLALAAAGTRLQAFFVGFMLLNLVSATQDIATDGLAVDTLVGSERGYANGIQVGGYRAGMVLGGGLLLLVLDRIGLPLAFVVLAGLTLVLSVPLGALVPLFPLFGGYLVLYLALHPALPVIPAARFGDLSYGLYIYGWPVEQTLLYLRPDLVQFEKAERDIGFVRSEFFYWDLQSPSPISFQEWFSRYSRTGTVGDPTKATREKGEKFVTAVVDRMIALIREFRGREIQPRTDHH